ncbi:MAG: class I SAM-dependent methyltransferase, partial [Crocinitomicaceae bacterium]|nr:class I SAM-dependent methyltransferase [Crocinitomicaceae bacterium]
ALQKNAPEQWSIAYKNLTFELQLTKFKHLGLFPEQRINWDFIDERLHEEDKFMNLFAYTGAASCVARNQGAQTLHVDSVKQLISWARLNMEASQLADIQWVHEDALKFAAREVKRGNKYAGIIMDPPAWGIGAKKEKWKLEDKLDELMRAANALIGKRGFLVLNTYSPKIDVNRIRHLAQFHFGHRNYEIKELWMKTTTGKDLYYGNLLKVI